MSNEPRRIQGRLFRNSLRRINSVRVNSGSIFIVLSGGPGIKKEDDPDHHDLSWANYVTAPALMWNAGTLTRNDDEEIHWLVYEPAYDRRWEADSGGKSPNEYKDTITTKKNLPSDKVRKTRKDWKLVWIRSEADFWSYIKDSPKKISRVWFYGHAGYGLYLDWTHPGIVSAKIDITSIGLNVALKGQFVQNQKDRPHKFFGCTTAYPTYNFANIWAQMFKVYAEGANVKVQFDKIADLGGRVYLSPPSGTAASASNWLQYDPAGKSEVKFSGNDPVQ